MNKSIWISAVIAIQFLLFVGLLVLGFTFHNVDWMQLENWMFILLATFVTLNYFYMGIEWGFGASPKPSEEEEVQAAFDKIDLNNDGLISREEAVYAGLARVFDKFNKNKAGRLTLEQFHTAFTCGLLRYSLFEKVKSFFTLGLAPVPSKD